MDKTPLNRRDFLRLCVLAAGGAVAAACGKTITEIVGTSTVSPSPAPAVKLSLGTNLDAWTWVKQMKVGVSEGECEKVILSVNGQNFQARPEGDYFIADIQLSEGENQITASCVQPGGGEVTSEPVVYTGRLRQAPTAIINIALEGGQIVLDGSETLPAENVDGAIVDYLWPA